MVRLCDAKCDVTFTKIDCMVRYRGCVLMTDSKDTKTVLWMLPFEKDGSTISQEATTILSLMPRQPT